MEDERRPLMKSPEQAWKLLSVAPRICAEGPNTCESQQQRGGQHATAGAGAAVDFMAQHLLGDCCACIISLLAVGSPVSLVPGTTGHFRDPR